ncbi:unnamed protein product [Anisakis simplex]|uniref:1-acyl-sn-glycerol-3-phosphate acyltransferase n=1 Tax=Anisakis simplex TaxID=6269 RepID=A0A0M3JS74_ANISI|nr:unnamed protein product [Anisakis simplex]
MADACECWYFLIISILLLSLLFSFVHINTKVEYFIKVTLLYLTILVDAILCCLVCTPAHFFGDPPKLIFNTFRVFSSWTGIKCDVRNIDNYTKVDRPYIVIANHQSSVDIVVLSHVWPPYCSIMMKKSLCWIPFFNYAAYLANTIFVDRQNHDKASQSIDECVNAIKHKNLSLFVFPEGTRNHERGLLPFKKGAFNIAVKAAIPIIPIVISSYKPFYDKEKRYFNSSGYVIAEVMEPISTKDLKLEDVPELTEKVRSAMIETYDRISKEAELKYNQQLNHDKSD